MTNFQCTGERRPWFDQAWETIQAEKVHTAINMQAGRREINLVGGDLKNIETYFLNLHLQLGSLQETGAPERWIYSIPLVGRKS